jgi:glutamate-1-semialdehyde 2,1-aminomutase
MSQLLSRQIEAAYRDTFPTSQKLYERGCSLFPSGVTHDARYLQPFPIYAERAEGSRKWDVDGHEIVDFWVGHGALLLGHSHPAVTEAVAPQVGKGTHPGACHELELEWGERVRALFPSCEMLRFTNSGTEATLMAIRVARIASGKSKVLKFAGHFHGWHDQLIPAGSPPHESGDYTMPGITDGTYGDLVVVPPNDLAALATALDEHDPACVILEGNGARWGVVPLDEEFLSGVRKLTAEKDVIFIHDEVITGFRVSPGGYQGHCGVTPDMTTMAKVLAGGLPGGCLGGRADLMQILAFGNSLGKKMKHPGTYNANPLSAAAGIACLDEVATGKPCDEANRIAALLRSGLNEMFAEKGANWVAYGQFSAIKILPEYDGPAPTGDDFIPYGNDYRKLDREFPPALSHAFRCAVLLGGIDWMGWGGSTSAAHSENDVDRAVTAFAGAIDLLREDGLID